MKNNKYDWIIVGAGAAGITIAEMLSRLDFNVLIIEKNQKLADETSGLFHEWLHTGSLYTLAPDKLETTRYLLGALDDLLVYYSIFKNMNLMPLESGLKAVGLGWFNNDNILYKYKVRPLNPIWSIIVARSLSLINEIKKHDWLRQRAGSKFEKLEINIIKILKFYPDLMADFTDHSHLHSLVYKYLQNKRIFSNTNSLASFSLLIFQMIFLIIGFCFFENKLSLIILNVTFILIYELIYLKLKLVV